MAIVDFLNRTIEDQQDEKIGIGGFTALARVNESFTLSSEAPTAYLEDGSEASDHIILKPLTLSISGKVGDVYRETSVISEAIKRSVSSVTQYNGFASSQSDYIEQQANAIAASVDEKARQLDDALSSGQQILSFAGDQTSARALQQQFVDAMEALHYGKQLISIDMPYRRYDLMRITQVVITRDGNTGEMRFQLQAQRVRKTSTEYVRVTSTSTSAGAAPAPASGLGGQTEGETDKGSQEGAEVESSSLFGIAGYLRGL